MSIITEALKKAEQEKKKSLNVDSEESSIKEDIKALKESKNSAAAESMIPYPTLEKKEKSPILFYAVVGLVFIVLAGGIFLLGQYYIKQNSVIVAPSAVQEVVEVKEATAVKIEPSVLVSEPKPNSIIQPAIDKIQELVVNSNPVSSNLKQIRAMDKNLKAQYLLSGIIDDPQSPAAIINSEIVEVGAIIGDARVVQITAKAVILEQNQQQIRLEL